MHALDQARADLITWTRCSITHRTARALEIERQYGLDGYPPQLVSLGLEAAAQGRCPFDAIADHMEASDD